MLYENIYILRSVLCYLKMVNSFLQYIFLTSYIYLTTNIYIRKLFNFYLFFFEHITQNSYYYFSSNSTIKTNQLPQIVYFT